MPNYRLAKARRNLILVAMILAVAAFCTAVAITRLVGGMFTSESYVVTTSWLFGALAAASVLSLLWPTRQVDRVAPVLSGRYRASSTNRTRTPSACGARWSPQIEKMERSGIRVTTNPN